MFKIVPRESIWWPVVVKIPRGDGTKKLDEYRFKLNFRLLGRKEMEDLENDADKDISDFILDWDGVADQDGEPLPFNSDNLDRLMDDIHIVRGIARAFRELQIGADSKN